REQRLGRGLPGAAAVRRSREAALQHEDNVRILWVDADLAEVHRSPVLVAHELPRVALVVGPPESWPHRVGRTSGLAASASAAAAPAAAFLSAAGGSGLYQRVHAVRGRAEEIEPATSPFAVRGQSAPFELLPRFAGADRLPHRAAGSAAVEAPGSSAALIRGGQQDIAVGRIHRDVDEACVVVDELRLRPRLPAVDRLEQAAL